MQLLPLLKKYWKLAAVAALLLCGYLAWSWYGARPPKPGAIMPAVESPKIATMPKKTITSPVVVVADKTAAAKKLKLPEPDLHEELQTAIDAPPLKHGGTVAVFLNTSTGQTRSVTIVKPVPWFALERGNILGAEVGIGAAGRYYQGDYQRDIFQIKGVYFSGRAAVTSYQDLTDWRIGFRGEYRW